MNEIEELISQKNENQQKELDRKALASDIGSHFQKTVLELKTANEVLAEGLKKVLTVVSQIKTQSNVSVQVETGKLEGILNEAVSKISQIKIDPPQIPKIKFPDIKVDAPIIPPIKVPTPEVTVNVPEQKQPKIIVRPNITVKNIPPKTGDNVRKVEEKDIYNEGFLDGYEIKYSNGTVEKMTGASTGRRKYEYR